MLGKDYTLAIIIVNCDDNIWNDQNLELDSDLPPGWRTIQDSMGTYYWHIPTGTTQWQHPSCSAENEDSTTHSTARSCKRLEPDGRLSPAKRCLESPTISINNRRTLSWQEDHFCINTDPDSKCFSVRSLGWVEIPDEDLIPGKSSIAMNNCIQQLSYSKWEGVDAAGACGQCCNLQGQDMVMVLKKDTLSLLDPIDHSLIHCQLLVNIRLWGVGCNNGRDFAFVASDKDTCMLKCHVFRCNVPAKAIAATLHEMCSKIIAEVADIEPPMPRSLTDDSMSPDDLPRPVDCLDSLRQRDQTFLVEYIGHLPVARALGMEVLNQAIENILITMDKRKWTRAALHISDTMLSLWKREDGDDPFWECEVRYLTFLGVGRDCRTFAVIEDTGRQRFECHVFWCEPHAGVVSEAVQTPCMVQFQKCLVTQTPPLKLKMWHPGKMVARANSTDSSSFSSSHRTLLSHKFGTSSVKRSLLAFFENFRSKQSPVPAP